VSSAASNQPLYLGIDLGTSGCRGIVIDVEGRQQAQAAVTLPSPQRDGKSVEQRPGLWLDGLQQVLRQLGPELLGQVAAIAVDGTSSTVLLTDDDGQPLGPALMYNDGRATSEAQTIAAHAPNDSAARGAGSSLAKLLWLLAQQTAKPAHVLHQADWISGWLLNRYGDSDENNCLKLGYDPQQRRWPDWLQALLPDIGLLPKVVPPGTPLGTVSATLATEFGLPPDSQIVSGTTDSTAGLIATGAAQVGDAVTTIGSTLVLKVLSDRPIASPEHGVYSHRLGDLWLVGGASNSGGAVLRQHFDDASITRLSTETDFDQPTGLDYYPLTAPGERFPMADPQLPPRLHPRPNDDRLFFQAMLEGIAAIEHQGYRLLQTLGAPYPTRIITSGGGAANRRWGRYRGKLIGVPESAAEHTEAAYGAALLARRGSP